MTAVTERDTAANGIQLHTGLQLPDDQETVLQMVSLGPTGFVERLPEPGGLPAWISAEEFNHYAAEFSRTGFTGALN